MSTGIPRLVVSGDKIPFNIGFHALSYHSISRWAFCVRSKDQEGSGDAVNAKVRRTSKYPHITRYESRNVNNTPLYKEHFSRENLNFAVFLYHNLVIKKLIITSSVFNTLLFLFSVL